MKLTLFIAEQVHGSVRPVEIAADAPIAMIIPALVEELHLPERDAHGELLHYALYLPPQEKELSGYLTFSRLGLIDGMTLTLGVNKPVQLEIVDGVLAPPVVPASDTTTAFHSSDTLADIPTLAPLSSTTRSHTPRSVPVTQTKKRGVTRRVVLATGFAALGAGIAGASYAAYRSFEGSLGAITTMNMQSVAPVQKRAVMPAVPTAAHHVLTFTGHQQTTRVIAWSPTGTLLASGADDAQLLIWGTDGAVARTVAHPGPVRAAAWSPDGTRMVTGSNNQVLFLNVPMNSILGRSTHRHTNVVMGVAWTAHNNTTQVVSAGLDMQAYVWDTVHYRSQLLYARHTAPIDAVTWAMDGRTVATSSHGGAVRIWDAQSGKDVHNLYYEPNLPLRAAAFSPNANTLAIGGDDGRVRLWDGVTCTRSVVTNAGLTCADVPRLLQVSKKPVRSLAWSPDGRFLATGSDDGVLSLWYPARNQQPLFQMTVKQDVAIYSVSWSPMGDQVAVTTGNNVVLWSLK